MHKTFEIRTILLFAHLFQDQIFEKDDLGVGVEIQSSNIEYFNIHFGEDRLKKGHLLRWRNAK